MSQQHKPTTKRQPIQLYDSHSGVPERKFLLPTGMPNIMTSDEGTSDPQVSEYLNNTQRTF